MAQENKKEKVDTSTENLLRVLGWTQENHPTRESLREAIPPEPVEPSYEDIYVKNDTDKSPFWKMLGGGTYTDAYQNYLNEIDKRYEAIGKLEVWDTAFGPKTPIIDYDDPAVIEAAKAKQAEYDATIAPMNTPEQELARMRLPAYIPGSIVQKLMYDTVKQVNEITEDDTFYTIEPVSYLFRLNPKNVEPLKKLQKITCKSNILQYEERFIPCAYLCVKYPTDRYAEAVDLLSKDLQLLGDYIVGNLSMPKAMTLFGDFEAMYFWPFVDYEKLAKSVNKDFWDDFQCKGTELLKFVGCKAIAYEGGDCEISLGSTPNKEYTDEDRKTAAQALVNGISDEDRKKMH